jgi:hypothetical protein
MNFRRDQMSMAPTVAGDYLLQIECFAPSVEELKQITDSFLRVEVNDESDSARGRAESQETELLELLLKHGELLAQGVQFPS